MPRPRAHAPNKQGGKPAGQDTSSYTKGAEYNRDRPNDDDEDSLDFSTLLVRSITL